jgi:hypothetical protein
MSDTTTAKRGRKASVPLTDRMCEKRVAKQTKIYDSKCAGLYVSIVPSGAATFYFKFTDKAIGGKKRSRQLGIYHPGFNVENARTEVYALRVRIGNGENIAESARVQKAQATKRGVTVDQVIAERIEWMKTPVLKRDGEMRPRIDMEQRRKPLAPLHQPTAWQEDCQRGHQPRHRAVVG